MRPQSISTESKLKKNLKKKADCNKILCDFPSPRSFASDLSESCQKGKGQTPEEKERHDARKDPKEKHQPRDKQGVQETNRKLQAQPDEQSVQARDYHKLNRTNRAVKGTEYNKLNWTRISVTRSETQTTTNRTNKLLKLKTQFHVQKNLKEDVSKKLFEQDRGGGGLVCRRVYGPKMFQDLCLCQQHSFPDLCLCQRHSFFWEL